MGRWGGRDSPHVGAKDGGPGSGRPSSELSTERKKEYEDEKDKAKSNLEKYWAGSAGSSVRRDYEKGRTKTVGNK